MTLTEKAKMLAGHLYRASDAELVADFAIAQQRLRELNSTPNEAFVERFTATRNLLGAFGEGSVVRSPFYCDYGIHIELGRNVFINYACCFLDCNRIVLGDDVQVGPGVHIYTAWHPLDAAQRRSGLEGAAPVKIGNDVWLGGSVIVLPGVTIGDAAVIGAGSVVTRDIAAGVLAAGNPCRALRTIR